MTATVSESQLSSYTPINSYNSKATNSFIDNFSNGFHQTVSQISSLAQSGNFSKELTTAQADNYGRNAYGFGGWLGNTAPTIPLLVATDGASVFLGGAIKGAAEEAGLGSILKAGQGTMTRRVADQTLKIGGRVSRALPVGFVYGATQANPVTQKSQFLKASLAGVGFDLGFQGAGLAFKKMFKGASSKGLTEEQKLANQNKHLETYNKEIATAPLIADNSVATNPLITNQPIHALKQDIRDNNVSFIKDEDKDVTEDEFKQSLDNVHSTTDDAKQDGEESDTNMDITQEDSDNILNFIKSRKKLTSPLTDTQKETLDNADLAVRYLKASRDIDTRATDRTSIGSLEFNGENGIPSLVSRFLIKQYPEHAKAFKLLKGLQHGDLDISKLSNVDIEDINSLKRELLKYTKRFSKYKDIIYPIGKKEKFSPEDAQQLFDSNEDLQKDYDLYVKKYGNDKIKAEEEGIDSEYTEDGKHKFLTSKGIYKTREQIKEDGDSIAKPNQKVYKTAQDTKVDYSTSKTAQEEDKKFKSKTVNGEKNTVESTDLEHKDLLKNSYHINNRGEILKVNRVAHRTAINSAIKDPVHFIRSVANLLSMQARIELDEERAFIEKIGANTQEVKKLLLDEEYKAKIKRLENICSKGDIIS